MSLSIRVKLKYKLTHFIENQGYSSYNFMGVTGSNFINKTWVMESDQ